jgi:uncharacterized delta-60 repeat protein
MARRILLKEGGLSGSIPSGFKSIGINNSQLSILTGSVSNPVDTYLNSVSLSGTDLTINSLGGGYSGTISLASIAGVEDFLDLGSSSNVGIIDLSSARTQEIFLDSNMTFTFSNPTIGVEYKLLLKSNSISNGTSSNNREINWPSDVIWRTEYPNPDDEINYVELDPNFSLGTSNVGFSISGSIQDILTLSDGGYIFGGSFTTYRGTTYNRILKMTSNGSPDASFSIGTGFDNSVNAINIQSDGKIICGGRFATYSGTSSNRIVRLSSTGSIDSSFSIGTGFTTEVGVVGVNKMTIQSDGKIICGGSFISYNGVSASNIIRLNSNGSIDNTFSYGSGFGSGLADIQSIVIQSDGKILVGGYFTTYNGVSANRIIRLNTDGTRDNTFDIGTGFNDFVQKISIQSNGKIICGGQFTTYNGVSVNRIIRLTTDGTRDNTFMGTGFTSGSIREILILNNDSILCFNTTSLYNGITQSPTLLDSNGNFLNIGQDLSRNLNKLSILNTNTAKQDSSGKIICAGSFSGFTFNGVNYRSNFSGQVMCAKFSIYSALSEVRLIYNGTNYIGYYKNLYY